jgi:hypothetical protein
MEVIQHLVFLYGSTSLSRSMSGRVAAQACMVAPADLPALQAGSSMTPQFLTSARAISNVSDALPISRLIGDPQKVVYCAEKVLCSGM